MTVCRFHSKDTGASCALDRDVTEWGVLSVKVVSEPVSSCGDLVDASGTFDIAYSTRTGTVGGATTTTQIHTVQYVCTGRSNSSCTYAYVLFHRCIAHRLPRNHGSSVKQIFRPTSVADHDAESTIHNRPLIETTNRLLYYQFSILPASQSPSEQKKHATSSCNRSSTDYNKAPYLGARSPLNA